MLRPQSIILAAVVALSACAPWYKQYGFASEAEASAPESAAKWQEVLRTGDGEQKVEAAMRLSRLDAAAIEPVYPQFVSVLVGQITNAGHVSNHYFHSACAAWTEGTRKIGRAAAPILLPYLGSDNLLVRICAIRAVGASSHPAPELMRTLRRLAKEDPSGDVKEEAARVLIPLEALEGGPSDAVDTNASTPALEDACMAGDDAACAEVARRRKTP